MKDFLLKWDDEIGSRCNRAGIQLRQCPAVKRMGDDDLRRRLSMFASDAAHCFEKV